MSKGILSPDTDKHPPGQSDIRVREDGFGPVVTVRQLSCQKEGGDQTISSSLLFIISLQRILVIVHWVKYICLHLQYWTGLDKSVALCAKYYAIRFREGVKKTVFFRTLS